MVLRFIKVDEFKHLFARIFYFRDDGLMGWYSPDIMVAAQDNVYLIETKSDYRFCEKYKSFRG